MSSIARWSYKNTATIMPFESYNQRTGETVYGTPYTIACNWIADSTQQRDQNNAEFVSKHIIYCEDPRPKYLDMIALGDSTHYEQIRSVTGWDMNMFNDTMDFKLIT